MRDKTQWQVLDIRGLEEEMWQSNENEELSRTGEEVENKIGRTEDSIGKGWQWWCIEFI